MMRFATLDGMTGGWFIGDFHPSALRTGEVEVAVKKYSAGDYERRHYHRVATETTCIISGVARMAGRKVVAGDIIVLDPLEETDFTALTDVVLVAVKLPGATNDKYDSRC
jgi:DNA-directed RNA polymerase beta' subunit